MESNTRLIDITWGDLCALLDKRDEHLKNLIAAMAVQPESKPADEYISDERAAEMLGVKKWTIHNKACSGQIPYYKVGGRMLFKAAEINAIIEQCRVSTGDEIAAKASNITKTRN